MPFHSTLSNQILDPMILDFLREDIPVADLSTLYSVPNELEGFFGLNFRESGVVCGVQVLERVFALLDKRIRLQIRKPDGSYVNAMENVAIIEGPIASILQGERLALNLIQRMSAIATLTAKYLVEAKKGNPGIRVTDTRKTTPGLRILEKYAVRVGGGHNHRMNLSDGVMLKDNHLQALQMQGVSLEVAIHKVKESMSHVYKLEVEIDRLDQIEPAILGGADILLLDNMLPDELIEALKIINGRVEAEASGGVTLETIATIAATGIAIISVGALTNSVASLDIGLDAIKEYR